MKESHIPNHKIEYDRETLLAYLRGTLDEKDMEAIQKAEKDSAVLATSIEGLRFLLETDGEAGIDPFLNSSWEVHDAQIEAHAPTEPESSHTRTFLSYARAAVVALLVGLGAFLMYSSLDSTSLVDQELAEGFPVERSQVRGTLSNTNSWEEAYLQEDFEKVVELLEDTSEKEERESFYLGMAYLQLRRYPRANIQFQVVLDLNNPNGFVEQAQWFKALSHKQREEPEAAQSLLEQIVEIPSHYKRDKAKTLLNE
ncbi:MAG: hypothetical protein AAGA10_18820 [Bacteroidota bacterium]